MPDESSSPAAGQPDGGDPAGETGSEADAQAADSDAAGHDDGSDAASRDAEGAATADEATGAPGDRDVVVPLRLYKTVTVFSTLIAIAAILAGFILLDRGTQRATASPDEVSLPVVALGLGLIVGGSAVYAFSTRFRTAGMGKSKDSTDEGSNNG